MALMLLHFSDDDMNYVCKCALKNCLNCIDVTGMESILISNFKNSRELSSLKSLFILTIFDCIDLK